MKKILANPAYAVNNCRYMDFSGMDKRLNNIVDSNETPEFAAVFV